MNTTNNNFDFNVFVNEVAALLAGVWTVSKYYEQRDDYYLCRRSDGLSLTFLCGKFWIKDSSVEISGSLDEDLRSYTYRIGKPTPEIKATMKNGPQHVVNHINRRLLSFVEHYRTQAKELKAVHDNNVEQHQLTIAALVEHCQGHLKPGPHQYGHTDTPLRMRGQHGSVDVRVIGNSINIEINYTDLETALDLLTTLI